MCFTCRISRDHNLKGESIMRSMISVSAMSLCVLAGHVTADDHIVTLEPSQGTVNRAGHIYYNAVTGERVVTLLHHAQTAPADTGTSAPIWATLVQNACEAQGYTSEFYFGLDDPTGGTPLSTGIQLLDYGDIEIDTVVDCIEVNWVVAHPDIDADSDGIVDGVEELGAQWVVWDAYNGRPECTRLPLVDILIFNLPGNTPENQNTGSLTGWTLDIDLVAFGSATDLSFEIGDSDGDCQSAAFCNSGVDYDSDSIPDGPVAGGDRDFDGLPDSDLDGDGLFDWGWSVNFIQPGQGNDFDSDSDTGTLPGSNSDTIGISFGYPQGSAIDNGDGTWTWNIDTAVSDAGTGQEDRFAIEEPIGGGLIYNGGYWFGGFACSGGLQSTGGTGYTPPAMFQFVLYGPDSPCDNFADWNADGEFNFFDVSLFIQDWQNGGDYNGDGQTDFFDVSQFLMDFNAGCP